MDLVFAVDRLPREGETLAGGDLALFPGGKGANQAFAAARLGGDVVMIAAVGADEFGHALVSSLNGAGVDTSRVRTSARPTGCACIYVMPGGANSIVISPGANADLDAEAALTQLHDLTANDFLLAQLETPLETVEAAFAHASGIGAMTVLDPAPARVLPASLIANSSLITPNQNEAGVLLGDLEFRIETTADAERAAGRSVEEGMRFANAAAAVSVTRRGAQNSAPSRADVEHILAGTGV
jgi:ribokinase